MQLVKLNSNNEWQWSEYIESKRQAVFFHTIEWKNIVEKVYGFKALYFMVIDSNKVAGILPAFLTNSVIFGRKIMTTPFNFYNGPIFDSKLACHILLSNLNNLGRYFKVKYVDYKNLEEINKLSCKKLNILENRHYLISELEIGNTDHRQLYSKRLKKNIRTLERKFDKANFSLKEITEISGLEEFYNIMIRSLRIKHNMIPQPFNLFEELFNMSKTNLSTKLFGAYDSSSNLIGGLFCLLFRNQATYAWGASDLNYSKFSPSTLLIDNLINFCSEEGFGSLDFGVTSPAHNTLLNFKNSWGCKTTELPYICKLISDTEIPSMDYHTSFANIRKPYGILPDTLVKYLSPLLVKHLT